MKYKYIKSLLLNFIHDFFFENKLHYRETLEFLLLK